MKALRSFTPLFAAFTLALGLAALVLLILGERPVLILDALRETFFTGFGLGYCLYYTTPLIFTGLAFAIPRQAGLFNIGAEGQLYLGAATLIALSPFASSLPILGTGLLIGGAMVGGAAWGWLAGFLRTRFGTHEVIGTLLLNFIGLGLVSFLILGPLKNPESPSPETVLIGEGQKLTTFDQIIPGLFETIPVNLSLILAVVLAVVTHWIFYRTIWGFELRAAGENPRASHYAGISVKNVQLLSFTLAGAIAGLVGVNDILGSEHRLVDGFSPGYGFTGIAVALLAKNRPLRILATAFLFGSLQNFSRELEFLSDKVSKELSLVLQASLLAFMASAKIADFFSKRSEKSRA